MVKCLKWPKRAKLKSTTLFYYVRQVAEMRLDISRGKPQPKAKAKQGNANNNQNHTKSMPILKNYDRFSRP